MSEPQKLVTLEAWAAEHMAPVPSPYTLRGMARRGMFQPPAVTDGNADSLQYVHASSESVRRGGAIRHHPHATRHRVKKPPSKGYDRSRIHLDRPKIKIASRDFH